MKVLSSTSRKSIAATVTAAAFLVSSTAGAATECEIACKTVGAAAGAAAYASVVRGLPYCKTLPSAAQGPCTVSVYSAAAAASYAAAATAEASCLSAC